MGLFGWLKRSGSAGNHRIDAWRREWERAAAAGDAQAAASLRADLEARPPMADDVEIEEEMLDGLERLVALPERAAGVAAASRRDDAPRGGGGRLSLQRAGVDAGGSGAAERAAAAHVHARRVHRRREVDGRPLAHGGPGAARRARCAARPRRWQRGLPFPL